MLLPQLRRSLKNINSNNQSLQDIVKSCSKATEVLSVEPYNGKVHNTKITLLIDKGSNYPEQERYVERVHFYNRLNLAEVLQNVYVDPQEDIEIIIEQLNNQGYDFTIDDVEFVNGLIKAKEESLGYYNGQISLVCKTTLSFACKFPITSGSEPNWYEGASAVANQIMDNSTFNSDNGEGINYQNIRKNINGEYVYDRTVFTIGLSPIYVGGAPVPMATPIPVIIRLPALGVENGTWDEVTGVVYDYGVNAWVSTGDIRTLGTATQAYTVDDILCQGYMSGRAPE